MNSKFDFKIVIVGDPNVGKSCLLTRFVENTFYRHKMYPITVDIKPWAIDLDGETIKLHIYYTTGIKRMRPMTRSYFDRSDGIIVTYDCTDLKSFNNVDDWMWEIGNHAPADVNKLLVATKCDLNTEKVVDYETAKEYADQMRIPFFETSAKKGTNVEAAFVAIVKEVRARAVVDHQLSVAPAAKRMRKEYLPIEGSDSSSASLLNNNNTRLNIAKDDAVTDLADLWSKIKKHQDDIAARMENKFDELAKELTQQFKETYTPRIEAANEIVKLGNTEEIATVAYEVVKEKVLCESCRKDIMDIKDVIKVEECNSPST